MSVYPASGSAVGGSGGGGGGGRVLVTTEAASASTLGYIVINPDTHGVFITERTGDPYMPPNSTWTALRSGDNAFGSSYRYRGTTSTPPALETPGTATWARLASRATLWGRVYHGRFAAGSSPTISTPASATWTGVGNRLWAKNFRGVHENPPSVPPSTAATGTSASVASGTNLWGRTFRGVHSIAPAVQTDSIYYSTAPGFLGWRIEAAGVWTASTDPANSEGPWLGSLGAVAVYAHANAAVGGIWFNNDQIWRIATFTAATHPPNSQDVYFSRSDNNWYHNQVRGGSVQWTLVDATTIDTNSNPWIGVFANEAAATADEDAQNGAIVYLSNLQQIAFASGYTAGSQLEATQTVTWAQVGNGEEVWGHQWFGAVAASSSLTTPTNTPPRGLGWTGGRFWIYNEAVSGVASWNPHGTDLSGIDNNQNTWIGIFADEAEATADDDLENGAVAFWGDNLYIASVTVFQPIYVDHGGQWFELNDAGDAWDMFNADDVDTNAVPYLGIFANANAAAQSTRLVDDAIAFFDQGPQEASSTTARSFISSNSVYYDPAGSGQWYRRTQSGQVAWETITPVQLGGARTGSSPWLGRLANENEADLDPDNKNRALAYFSNAVRISSNFRAAVPETYAYRYEEVAAEGLVLGRATNQFSGANEAAAESARNTYQAATSGWLNSYNENPTHVIILTYGSTTKFQARRGSAWVDVTPVVQGLPGVPGPAGPAGTSGLELSTVNALSDLATPAEADEVVIKDDSANALRRISLANLVSQDIVYDAVKDVFADSSNIITVTEDDSSNSITLSDTSSVVTGVAVSVADTTLSVTLTKSDGTNDVRTATLPSGGGTNNNQGSQITSVASFDALPDETALTSLASNGQLIYRGPGAAGSADFGRISVSALPSGGADGRFYASTTAPTGGTYNAGDIWLDTEGTQYDGAGYRFNTLVFAPRNSANNAWDNNASTNLQSTRWATGSGAPTPATATFADFYVRSGGTLPGLYVYHESRRTWDNILTPTAFGTAQFDAFGNNQGPVGTGRLLYQNAAAQALQSVNVSAILSQALIYSAVKDILVHNTAVTADDMNNELDIAASALAYSTINDLTALSGTNLQPASDLVIVGDASGTSLAKVTVTDLLSRATTGALTYTGVNALTTEASANLVAANDFIIVADASATSLKKATIASIVSFASGGGGGGISTEDAQDAAGGLITGLGGFTYNDSNNTLTFSQPSVAYTSVTGGPPTGAEANPTAATETEADEGTVTAERSWTPALVRRAAQAGVADWAEEGNTTAIPASKLQTVIDSKVLVYSSPEFTVTAGDKVQLGNGAANLPNDTLALEDIAAFAVELYGYINTGATPAIGLTTNVVYKPADGWGGEITDAGTGATRAGGEAPIPLTFRTTVYSDETQPTDTEGTTIRGGVNMDWASDALSVRVHSGPGGNYRGRIRVFALLYAEIGDVNATEIVDAINSNASRTINRNRVQAPAEATTTTAGLLSASDKTKLDSVDSNAADDQTGAEMITAINAQSSGTINQARLALPATISTSEADTGTGTATRLFTPALTRRLVGEFLAEDVTEFTYNATSGDLTFASTGGSSFTVGSTTPTGGSDGDIYFRHSSASNPGVYYRDSGSWEHIGGQVHYSDAEPTTATHELSPGDMWIQSSNSSTDRTLNFSLRNILNAAWVSVGTSYAASRIGYHASTAPTTTTDYDYYIVGTGTNKGIYRRSGSSWTRIFTDATGSGGGTSYADADAQDAFGSLINALGGFTYTDATNTLTWAQPTVAYTSVSGGPPTGAEANVQADWTQATNTHDGFILNKPATASNAEVDAGTESGVRMLSPALARRLVGQFLAEDTTEFSYNESTGALTFASSGGGGGGTQSDWTATSGNAQILNQPALMSTTEADAGTETGERRVSPALSRRLVGQFLEEDTTEFSYDEATGVLTFTPDSTAGGSSIQLNEVERYSMTLNAPTGRVFIDTGWDIPTTGGLFLLDIGDTSAGTLLQSSELGGMRSGPYSAAWLRALPARTAGTDSAGRTTDYGFAIEAWGIGNNFQPFMWLARSSTNDLLIATNADAVDPSPLKILELVSTQNVDYNFVNNLTEETELDPTDIVMVGDVDGTALRKTTIQNLVQDSGVSTGGGGGGITGGTVALGLVVRHTQNVDIVSTNSAYATGWTIPETGLWTFDFGGTSRPTSRGPVFSGAELRNLATATSGDTIADDAGIGLLPGGPSGSTSTSRIWARRTTAYELLIASSSSTADPTPFRAIEVTATFTGTSGGQTMSDPVQDHTIYIGAGTSPSPALSSFTVNNSADTSNNVLTFPAFTVNSYVYIAIPDAQTLTGVYQDGDSSFNERGAFTAEANVRTLTLGRARHKVYTSLTQWLPLQAGQDYTYEIVTTS